MGSGGRPKLDRAPVARLGLRRLTEIAAGIAPIDVHLGIVILQGERPGEDRQGLLRAPRRHEREPQRLPRERRLRIRLRERDGGTLEVGERSCLEGALERADLGRRGLAGKPRLERLQGRGCRARCPRLDKRAPGVRQSAATGEGGDIAQPGRLLLRRRAQGRLEVGQRLGDLSKADGEAGEIVVGEGVRWLSLQDGPVQTLGLRQVPRLVALDRAPKSLIDGEIGIRHVGVHVTALFTGTSNSLMTAMSSAPP